MNKIYSLIFAGIIAFTAAVYFLTDPKPITIITGMSAGSSPDTVLRKITPHLEQKWGRKVVVLNKPGAGGLLALEHFNKVADKNTIFYSDMSNFTSVPLLYPEKNLINDLDALGGVYDNHSWVIVTAANKTNEELEADIKARGSFGSWGVGSAVHIGGIEVVDQLGGTPVHVPYKNFSQWFTDVSNNDLAFSIISFGSSKSMVEAGKIRWVATTGTERHPAFADTPTIKELFGIERFTNRKGWLAFYSKKGTSNNLDQLQKDVHWAINQPDVLKQLETIYAYEWNASPNELDKQQNEDYNDYVKLFEKFSVSIEK